MRSEEDEDNNNKKSRERKGDHDIKNISVSQSVVD